MLTVTSQIQEIFQERVAERQIDAVGIVEQLLVLATHVGEIRCTLAGPDKLRFEIRGHVPLEVPLTPAKSRLRMMCARLGVLCRESGQDTNLYGDQGTINQSVVPSPNGQPDGLRPATWHVRFKNTPGEQEFTITAT